jgi:hypothetical protein
VQYQMLANDRYGLSFETFDAGQELVIDPLVYASYLGGYGPDQISNIAIDSLERKAAVGSTWANDFPTTPGAYQQHPLSNARHGFVTLFNASADSAVFSTYLSGPDETTYLFTIGCALGGAIYAAGITYCHEWPLTPDAFDTVNSGTRGDGVFVRLSGDGARLEYGSFLGGNDFDRILTLKVTSSNQVILGGETSSDDFPITANALFSQRGSGGAGFFSVFNSATSHLDYSSYIPGNYQNQVDGICLAGPQRFWLYGYTESTDFPTTPDALQPHLANPIATSDGFFMLMDLNENRLVYSSFLGGSNLDGVWALQPRDSNCIVVAGITGSRDFPVTAEAYDTVHINANEGYVSVIELPNILRYSTLLGGASGATLIHAMSFDSRGCVVSGFTNSPNFPVTANAYDTSLNDGQSSSNTDFFISRLDTQLAHLVYSTFIGGNGDDRCYSMVVDRSHVHWLIGETNYDFPVTPNAFQYDNHGIGEGAIAAFQLPDSGEFVGRNVKLVPENLSLSVFPNPFNPTTTISFSLPISSPVRFDVFNLLGRSVYRADLGRLNAGTHQQLFNLPGLASGTYVVRLKAGGAEMSRKMMVVR